MGFFDILLGVALLDSLSNNKKKQPRNDSFESYNCGYNDGYNDACSDRLFDDDCDCGYCEDHDSW